jgi:hypothetical protein
MTRQEFESSIRSTREFLQACEILRTANRLVSLTASYDFRQLALNAETTYRTLFLCGMSARDYNFLLTDYSYLQFTFFETEHYRHAFYPNPFGRTAASAVKEYGEALERGEISYEEYAQLLAEEPVEIGVPILRFEMYRAGYVRLCHPAAHLHVGMHGENRWPVARELTPRLFTLFVVKSYYGASWATTGHIPLSDHGFDNKFDETYVREKERCQLLRYEIFHQHERSQLHIV